MTLTSLVATGAAGLLAGVCGLLSLLAAVLGGAAGGGAESVVSTLVVNAIG